MFCFFFSNLWHWAKLEIWMLLNCSRSFWRIISIISKWDCLVFVWQTNLRSWRQIWLCLCVLPRILNTLLSDWAIILTRFVVYLRFDGLIILSVVFPIAHHSWWFWIRFSSYFIKKCWQRLWWLISIPNSKMSIIVINLV